MAMHTLGHRCEARGTMNTHNDFGLMTRPSWRRS